MPSKDPKKLKEQRARADAKRAGQRTRNWATIIYPESAPPDWRERLEKCFVPCLISPLHDNDLNPTGEPKKPHYHVLLIFETIKNREQVKEVVDLIGGIGCEKLNSLRGYARYLCHLDNPEKAQYNVDEVSQFGGVDFKQIIELASDLDESAEELLDFCELNQITSFAQIRRYVRVNRPDWAQALRTRSIYISMTLKSMSWEIDNGIARVDDMGYKTKAD